MAHPDARYPCSSIEDDFNYGSCVASASVHIRMAFLRKVYSILSVQVLLTTVTSALFLYFESIRTFVHESPALVLVFALGSFGMILALTLNRHKYPLNLYLLFGFTLLEALTVAFVGILEEPETRFEPYTFITRAQPLKVPALNCALLLYPHSLSNGTSRNSVTVYDVRIVLQAFLLTAAVFLGLTVYTLQSKRDFSKFGAGLFTVLWILCLSGFLKLFFYSETMELVLAAVGALLFCGFIVYDTHSLMHRLSPEEYVLAAISLYLDIINLFLHLLRFLEAVNKK